MSAIPRWCGRSSAPLARYGRPRGWRRWLRVRAVELGRHTWGALIDQGRMQCGVLLDSEPPPGHPERIPGDRQRVPREGEETRGGPVL